MSWTALVEAQAGSVPVAATCQYMVYMCVCLKGIKLEKELAVYVCSMRGVEHPRREMGFQLL